MTAQPHRCEVVDLINARRNRITACNSVYPPASHDAELAEAAPFWTDMHEQPAFEWHNHNGTMMIDPRFPALKSQAEIDAEVNFAGVPGPIAWLVVSVVIVGAVVGSWLLGVM